MKGDVVMVEEPVDGSGFEELQGGPVNADRYGFGVVGAYKMIQVEHGNAFSFMKMDGVSVATGR
ncbi:hypothetical protein DESC_350040 [Desulfosarcina cetonica]|nr:hypothetical protein DESC_350040 [Desulfosarcina cetonica]